MNKKDLIKSISETALVSQSNASTILDALLATIAEGLAKGESVTLVGFGTFSPISRKARTMRNPANGKAVEVAEKNVVKFKPGKKLLGIIN